MQIKSKIYHNLEATQKYEVRMFRKPGAQIPKVPLTVDMADHDSACREGFDLRFVETSWRVERLATYGLRVADVDGCGENGPIDRPTTFQRCEGGQSQTVLRINPGPQTKARPIGMRM